MEFLFLMVAGAIISIIISHIKHPGTGKDEEEDKKEDKKEQDWWN